LQIALRIGAVASAIGLDVFALSIAVGIKRLPWISRIRLGGCFAVAEISMQGVGLLLGTGFGRLVGSVATWIGLAILAGIGAWILREGFESGEERHFDVETPIGLLLASLSISLDSLGVGFALPFLKLPIVPLFAVVACSTGIFTLTGLAFGEYLGHKFEKNAERGAGIVLILLAIFFAVEKVRGF
jgi:putative Mn2+ efflux pump MntP